MEDFLARLWENLVGRISGPLSFRLLLQPLVASVLAVRGGLDDARAGKPPYSWVILTSPDDRVKLLRDGWKSVARVFGFAVVMDVAYQVMVYRWIYPLELLIVAIVLACIPYLLVRGPADRLAAIFQRSRR